jgi:hypothetical protein
MDQGAPTRRGHIDLRERAKAQAGGLGKPHVLAARPALGQVFLDIRERSVRQGAIHVGSEELLGVPAEIGR